MVRGLEATGARPLRRLPTLASVAHYAEEGRRSKNAKQRDAPGIGTKFAFVRIHTRLGAVVKEDTRRSDYLIYVIKRTWPCPILQDGGVAAIMHKLCRTCATPRRWNRYHCRTSRQIRAPSTRQGVSSRNAIMRDAPDMIKCSFSSLISLLSS
ncbi:hypothetical protein C8Q72DRAFT_274793 [Fomitopsis betulina]|nr:hypothetical protein C8Q72DRAFT_274793 [Fomitopsis betulina]